MGYYTTFRSKITLKKDTPQAIITFFDDVINKEGLSDSYNNSFNHEFFKCERWQSLFHSINGCDDLSGSKYYKKGDYYVVETETEFKNYDKEIQLYFDFIAHYVVGRKKKIYLGKCKGEQFDDPEFYFHKVLFGKGENDYSVKQTTGNKKYQ
jgi:hypothetical protein